LAVRIEAIDNELMNEVIATPESIAKRVERQGEKRALLRLLSYFNLPDISYIEDELKNYE